MKHCPSCQQSYPSEYTLCPRDGAHLVEASLWSEGNIIRDKYRVLAKVGEGGMGAVYKALHLRFNELRAIKVLKAVWVHDPEFVKRFEHEGVVARRLQHPNVVHVDDIDVSEDGSPFIVMEYVKGRSLRDLIGAEAPLDPRRVLNIAKQVAAALDAAHQLGMVHRDIKPDNITLVDTSAGEQVKVLDFGIAKLKEDAAIEGAGAFRTATGTVLGTPQYMSPEQATGRRGDELDGRSDLYSLGVVIYQMLSGGLPFKADTTTGWLLAHAKTPPTPLGSARAGLETPKRLERLVMRLLEKKPELRPATGMALISEIEESEKEIPLPKPTGVEALGLGSCANTKHNKPSRTRFARLSVSHWLVLGILAASLLGGGWLYFVVYLPTAHARKGKILYDKQDFGGAVREYSKAVRSKPENAEFHSRLGLALAPQCRENLLRQWESSGRRLETAMKEEFLRCRDGALREHREAVRLQPSNAEFHYNLGHAYLPDQESVAISEFREAIRLKPDYAEAHLALGDALARFAPGLAVDIGPGRPPSKVSAFDQNRAQYLSEYAKAVRLKPDYAEAHDALKDHLDLDYSVGGERDLTEAMTEFREALRVKPDDARLHLYLAACLIQSGDVNGAIEEYRAATRLKPDDAASRAHARIGHILSEKGDKQGAIAEYREAVRLNPKDSRIHRDLAGELRAVQDLGGAIVQYREALRIEPNNCVSHWYLGEALEAKGDLKQALEEYKNAIADDPGGAIGGQRWQAHLLQVSRKLPKMDLSDLGFKPLTPQVSRKSGK